MPNMQNKVTATAEAAATATENVKLANNKNLMNCQRISFSIF